MQKCASIFFHRHSLFLSFPRAELNKNCEPCGMGYRTNIQALFSCQMGLLCLLSFKYFCRILLRYSLVLAGAYSVKWYVILTSPNQTTSPRKKVKPLEFQTKALHLPGYEHTYPRSGHPCYVYITTVCLKSRLMGLTVRTQLIDYL